MPDQLDVRIRISGIGECILGSIGPHCFKVGVIRLGNFVDNAPNACYIHKHVGVMWIELELSPAHCVKIGWRETG